jgi:hypothetical protein
MTTKTVTPATLRTEAAKQKVGKPMRFGIEYSWYNADNLDCGIIERQQSAIKWRTDLATAMEAEGVTKVKVKTVRYRFKNSSMWITTTLYLYTDGSVFRTRRMVNGKQELRLGTEWVQQVESGEIVVAK